MISWVLKTVFSFALLFVLWPNGIAQNNIQPANDRKIVIESFVISGTQSIDSTELAEITNSMSGSKFKDDPDELEERIRAQFQDHGYFTVTIQKLDIKTLDPIASPKPVRLEAQITEGPHYRLSGIDFIGNHALSSAALRAKFPMKMGDGFRRSKVAAGLIAMQKLYSSLGFLDCTFIPDTKSDSSSTMKLNIVVEEGPQYRMDKLEVSASQEVADKLQVGWNLEPGAIFNSSYLKTFLEENHSLFPADFNQSNGVDLIKDCPDATVSVRLSLTNEPQDGALNRTKPVECSDSKDDSKK
ncbi:MAG TPA: POTRA domain-containing protein [Terriglobales bacterium]|nr:POTRA domain-containing protein [Terriglobales bacterium]